MLVVKRKIGETLLIGDSIRVKLVNVGPGQRASIGIEAPEELFIYREEGGFRKLEEIKRARSKKASAAQTPTPCVIPAEERDGIE